MRVTKVYNDLISHSGTISSIGEHFLTVKIISQTACAACHAKGACTSADQQEKEINIHSFDGSFSIGEEVLVTTEASNGRKAVFFAYLLPLILLVVMLISLRSISGNEALAALGSILLLLPYYLLLWIFRKKLQDAILFTVHKQPNTVIHE